MNLFMRFGAAVIAVILAVLLGALQPAIAQSTARTTSRVVNACGTPPYTYSAGNYEWDLQDIYGRHCDGGSPVTVVPSTANLTSGTLTSFMTGTTSTPLLAAPAAGNRNYITALVCWNSHATVNTGVDVQDGNSGPVIWSLPASAVYGGAVIPLPTPLKQPTLATALYVVDETTGASVKCSAAGFTAP